MKKALIVLLLLAFVVGSVFAQEGLTFSARVMAGLGFWKVGDNDAGWGLMTPSGTTRGMRWNFIANYKNADGTKGVYTYLRSRGSGAGNRTFNSMSTSNGFHILYAEGWFTAFDGLLKVQGGKMTDSPFGYGDWWGVADPIDAAYGLAATINATDAIKFGFGATSANGIDRMLAFGGDHSDPDPSKHINGVNLYGGFAGDFGAVSANAYFEGRKEDVNAHAAVTIKLDGLKIGLPVYIFDISNFGDTNEVLILPYVNFTGIDKLTVDFFLNIGFKNNDATAGNWDDEMGECKDPAFGGMLGVSYSFGNIIPRLAIAYMSGATYCGVSYGLKECIWDFNSYDKGDAYLMIRPQVRTRTSASSYVDFGFVLTSQLGDNKPDNALSFGAFIDFSVSF